MTSQFQSVKFVAITKSRLYDQKFRSLKCTFYLVLYSYLVNSLQVIPVTHLRNFD